MSKKYLVPIAIGVGVLLLVLVAAVLVYNGSTNEGGAAAAVALAAAEVARRRRATAAAELDDLADDATEDNEDLHKVLDEAEKQMAENEKAAEEDSLASLVDEENERIS